MKPDEQTLTETMIDTVVENVMGGKKNIALDSQIFSTLTGCARLVDFRFNHNFVSIQGKSNSIECGSIVHKFLEVYYKTIIGGIKRDEACGYGLTAAQLYITGCPHCAGFKSDNLSIQPSCGHKPDEYPGVFNTPPEPNKENPLEKYKTGWKWVLETCEQYHNYYRNDHWIPLEVEVVKGELLYEDSDIRIIWKAKLDLVCDTNQGIFPVDHKTMKQKRDTIPLNSQFIGQCLIQKTQKVLINKVGLQTSLKAEEKFERLPLGYSASQLIEWRDEILPFYAKMLLMYAETGYFPPNFMHCETKYGTCAFLPVCKVDPLGRENAIRDGFMVGPTWDIPSEETNGD